MFIVIQSIIFVFNTAVSANWEFIPKCRIIAHMVFPSAVCILNFGHLWRESFRLSGNTVWQFSHLASIPQLLLCFNIDCLWAYFLEHLWHVNGSVSGPLGLGPLQKRRWLCNAFKAVDVLLGKIWILQRGQNLSSCDSRCCLKRYQFVLLYVHFSQIMLAGFGLLGAVLSRESCWLPS